MTALYPKFEDAQVISLLTNPRFLLINIPKNEDRFIMAKSKTRIAIRLVSSEGTGYFYVAHKNPRTHPDKMVVRKYDPKARKHVDFREAKIK